MTKSRFLGLMSSCLLLSACASINNTLVTEQTLQNKASSVLHANPDNIVITNKHAKGEYVEFTASLRDKTYQCHYTAGLIKQTDTICN